MGSRRAFTLVELLVVVAILSLLLSLLAPTLGRARELTRKEVCASNERQIVTACMTYSVNERGTWPTGARSSPNWQTWDQLLIKFGIQGSIILCPSRGDLKLDGTRHYWTNANFDNAAWGNTANSTGVMSHNWSAKGMDIEVPADTAAYTEMRKRMAGYADPGGPSVPGSGWGWGLWAWDDLFILTYAHLGLENIPFCDGHVTSMNWEQLLGSPAGGTYTLSSPFYYLRRVKKGQ